MSGVQGLFGGGDAGDEQKAKAQDFINRYQKNPAGAEVSDQEAIEQLQQVAKVATPEQMQRAFQQSVASLPDNERAQFNQMLQQRQAGQGMIDIERSGERKAVDARGGGGDDSVGLDDLLGGILGGMAGGSAGSGSGGGGLGDILGGLLGGGASGNTGATSGGGLGDILSGMLDGGGAAAQPAPADDNSGGLGDLFGDLLNSPIGKAVLAGTAAY
ncbi:MAG: hypothetical protein KC438_01135, partial [Thermomicrobiales bacterium]|nr:hypothetical protein [Thermomicrobiales bacterium]